MASIHMLPNNEKDFKKFCKIIKKNKKKFFFIFENISCSSLKELKDLTKKFSFYKKLNKII